MTSSLNRLARVVFLAVGLLSAPLLAAQSASPDAVERGKQTFKERCRVCHEEYSTGTKVMGIKLDGLFKRQNLLAGKPVNEANVAEVIKMGPTPGMPGFRYTLSDQEISDIVSFLKTK